MSSPQVTDNKKLEDANAPPSPSSRFTGSAWTGSAPEVTRKKTDGGRKTDVNLSVKNPMQRNLLRTSTREALLREASKVQGGSGDAPALSPSPSLTARSGLRSGLHLGRAKSEDRSKKDNKSRYTMDDSSDESATISECPSKANSDDGIKPNPIRLNASLEKMKQEVISWLDTEIKTRLLSMDEKLVLLADEVGNCSQAWKERPRTCTEIGSFIPASASLTSGQSVDMIGTTSTAPATCKNVGFSPMDPIVNVPSLAVTVMPPEIPGQSECSSVEKDRHSIDCDELPELDTSRPKTRQSDARKIVITRKSDSRNSNWHADGPRRQSEGLKGKGRKSSKFADSPGFVADMNAIEAMHADMLLNASGMCWDTQSHVLGNAAGARNNKSVASIASFPGDVMTGSLCLRAHSKELKGEEDSEGSEESEGEGDYESHGLQTATLEQLKRTVDNEVFSTVFGATKSKSTFEGDDGAIIQMRGHWIRKLALLTLLRFWGVVTWSANGSCSLMYRIFVIVLALGSGSYLVLATLWMDAQYLPAIPMAIGAILGLASISIGLAGQLTNYPGPLEMYAYSHNFLRGWNTQSFKRFGFMLTLWLLAVLSQSTTELLVVFGLSCEADGDVLGLVCFIFVSGVFALLMYYQLHVYGMLGIMVDQFCVRFAFNFDGTQEIFEWNVIQALLRRVAGAFALCFVTVETMAVMSLLVTAARIMFASQRSLIEDCGLGYYVLARLPYLFLCLGASVVLLAAVSVTEKCSRVPTLVNAMLSEDDRAIQRHRQNIVQYITSSNAGFYVMDVRLTAQMSMKVAYLVTLGAFAVFSKIASDVVSE